MADIEEQSPEDLLKALEGSGYLVNGEVSDTTSLSSLPAAALKSMLGKMYRSIDANVAPKKKPATVADAMNKQPEAGVGAKDNLKDIIKQARDGTLTSQDQIQALESSMYMAGFNVSFDSQLNEPDFNDFAKTYDTANSDLSDTLVAKQAADVAQAAADLKSLQEGQDADWAESKDIAETAANLALQRKQQSEQLATINDQFKAGLVFSGYLSADDVNNPDDVVFAMRDLLTDHQPAVDVHTEINKDFDIQNGYAPTQTGLDTLKKLTDGQLDVQKFGEFFNSDDPAKAELAQHYMDMKGLDNKAATALAYSPLTIPSQIFLPTGEIDYGQFVITAVNGTMPLPNTPEAVAKVLHEDELQAYNALPAQANRTNADCMSREEYLASVLTDPDTTRYQAYLDSENAVRAEAALKVAVIQPVQETENTNNPLGFVAAGKGDDALTYGTDLSNHAVAQTTSGEAVYQGDDATYAFIDYMKGPGDANGQRHDSVTMYDALQTLYFAKQTNGQAELLPAQLASMGGGSMLPEKGYADELERAVRNQGKPADQFNPQVNIPFDLNNPNDIKMLMTALNADAQAQKGTLDMSKGDNIVVAYLNDTKFSDDVNSVTRVAENEGVNPLGSSDVRVAETPDAATQAAPVDDPEVAAHYAAEEPGADPLAPTLLSGKIVPASLIPLPVNKDSEWITLDQLKQSEIDLTGKFKESATNSGPNLEIDPATGLPKFMSTTGHSALDDALNPSSPLMGFNLNR